MGGLILLPLGPERRRPGGQNAQCAQLGLAAPIAVVPLVRRERRGVLAFVLGGERAVDDRLGDELPVKYAGIRTRCRS